MIGYTATNLHISRPEGFPYAPVGWNEHDAEALAHEIGITLGADHFDVIRCLQEYFTRNSERGANIRELHDALDEHFHSRGGIKYLYWILPGGPVAQGCALAGLPTPAGTTSRSQGSVQ